MLKAIVLLASYFLDAKQFAFVSEFTSSLEGILTVLQDIWEECT